MMTTSTGSDAAQQRFTRAVAGFRAWAETVPGRYGEWECDYPHWEEIYEAFREVVATTDVAQWSHELVGTVLYAIARDNECEAITRELSPAALHVLAKRAFVDSEPDARWQLAAELGNAHVSDREALLLQLVEDHNEYVRRRALDSLARIGSSSVTELALREWSRASDEMPWPRMNALSALRQVDSPAYAAKLAEARVSTNTDLASFAEKLMSGAADS